MLTSKEENTTGQSLDFKGKLLIKPEQTYTLVFRTADHPKLPPCPALASSDLVFIVFIEFQLFTYVCFSCLVKITGDLTMSFPAGITRIFNANPNAPVLSFRLVNISRVDHFLPNQKLLYRYDGV